ncbi:hypothetical protein [Leuconostoc mesenteroides]|uniref:hypothetical protein n=1 Tax=Leuconostoc mesenteroides TaxID=1245 RepID=UPI000B9D70B3|nr:hypothetical protein [Leuconostoc mesenteroides]BAX72857.1 hypothetical protein LEMES_01414 [Leuconostoc mesenteroides]
MEKIKANKVWITVIVIGVVIIGILLLMLNQQKQATPAAQESSYSASVKASSSSQITQDQENLKLYAKKAAKMKGHVLSMGHDYFTTWTKKDFQTWAAKYNALSDNDKYDASTNFGTSETISNNSMDTRPLQTMADTITAGDFKTVGGGGYYETVTAFNKAYPAVNPDDIIK